MGKTIPRVYADTSVFGGVCDDEFMRPSKLFFDSVRRGSFRLVVSDVVRREISLGPEGVRVLLDEMLPNAEIAEITQEALQLRAAYHEAKIVSPRHGDDALHVALATVSRCAMIVSWNFKHIVHYDKIDSYNAVSASHGHKPIGIFSPWQVIDYAEHEEDI